MTMYGFRLFTIGARLGMRPRPLQFGDGLLNNPVQTLVEQIEPLRGQVFARDATYAPVVQQPDPATPLPARTPVLRIDGLWVRGTTVRVDVSYGRIGDYSFAMNTQGSQDLSLDGHAAARRYTNFIHLPTHGEQAILVSGTTGRTHAGLAVLKRAAVQAYVRADPTGADWVRWTHGVLLDDSRIDEVASQGRLEGLRLKRKGYNAAGDRTTRNLTLTQNGIREGDVPKVRSMIRGWVQRAAGDGQHASSSSEIQALVELVDGDVSGVGFNDGVISYSENGKTQVIGPSSLDKILVYPVDDVPPTADALLQVSSYRLRPLLQAIGAPIDLP